MPTRMKDLKIHVERIVRPVRARQSRKLRMRRELLSHLQAALAEETSRESDETTALENAKQRLGEPAELTRELQRSVPPIERVMQSRTPDKWNGWEKRSGRVLGLYDLAILGHWLILFGTGVIAVMLISMFSPHIPRQARITFLVDQIDHPGRARSVIVAACVIQMVWFYLGMRFLTLAAAPPARFRWWRVITKGMLTLVSQALLMMLIVTQIVRRSPTVTEMAQSLGISLILLGVALGVGRGVAVLREPYDEWLTLELE
jgi:hypothetical protein